MRLPTTFSASRPLISPITSETTQKYTNLRTNLVPLRLWHRFLSSGLKREQGPTTPPIVLYMVLYTRNVLLTNLARLIDASSHRLVIRQSSIVSTLSPSPSLSSHRSSRTVHPLLGESKRLFLLNHRLRRLGRLGSNLAQHHAQDQQTDCHHTPSNATRNGTLLLLL